MHEPITLPLREVTASQQTPNRPPESQGRGGDPANADLCLRRLSSRPVPSFSSSSSLPHLQSSCPLVRWRLTRTPARCWPASHAESSLMQPTSPTTTRPPSRTASTSAPTTSSKAARQVSSFQASPSSHSGLSAPKSLVDTDHLSHPIRFPGSLDSQWWPSAEMSPRQRHLLSRRQCRSVHFIPFGSSRPCRPTRASRLRPRYHRYRRLWEYSRPLPELRTGPDHSTPLLGSAGREDAVPGQDREDREGDHSGHQGLWAQLPRRQHSVGCGGSRIGQSPTDRQVRLRRHDPPRPV